MSDINPKRMIPLHIADQAVAACDAEIQKLREENARLREENARLRDLGKDLVIAIENYHEDTFENIEFKDKVVAAWDEATKGCQP